MRVDVGVPFVDLAPIHASLRPRLVRDLERLIDDGAFTNGPEVALFEREFATFCGAAFCVGVSSGLDALRLALLAAEIEPGDEVILPAMTFAATAEAVLQAGGTPVFVDSSEDDWNIDCDAAASVVAARTRFLLPVHLYGQLADLARLGELAAQRDLTIVEDACQAHGARRGGLGAGAVGRASAFSFYPGKNLGAMGDAGALVTDDAAVAAGARSLREHGQCERYLHERVGYTARLDTIQALVLSHKLRLLRGWNRQRRVLARRYLAGLSGLDGVQLPPVPSGSEPVWHLFVIRVAGPDELAVFLTGRGIATGRHYPLPLHLAPAYRGYGPPAGSLPVAEAIARECISLPLFPGMTGTQVDQVIDAVREFVRRG
jgi:dTDP-4-amino-4,6-dideoxygalactose transaminase